MPVAQSSTIEGTPQSLLGDLPCLACLSNKGKLAVIALLLSYIANAGRSDDETAAELAADAACLECLSETQMLQAFGNLLYEFALAAGYITAGEDVIGDSKCLNCLDEKMIKAIILKQFVDYAKRMEALISN